MIIIGSDSEIMYFPPSFHFKKGLAKFTIEVRLIRGFRQKGAFSALSRGASYTRMRLNTPSIYGTCIELIIDQTYIVI